MDPGPFFDPSVAGGAATGLLTGGIGEFTSSLGLAGRLPLNATAAFTGNFAGNSLTQAFKNGGLDDYDATEAMRSGIFGAAFSSGEGNVVRFAESAVAKETAEKTAFKIATESGTTIGETVFEEMLEPVSSFGGTSARQAGMILSKHTQ